MITTQAITHVIVEHDMQFACMIKRIIASTYQLNCAGPLRRHRRNEPTIFLINII